MSHSNHSESGPVCDCYPGGFTPDSYEGVKEDCPVHGRQGVEALAWNTTFKRAINQAIDNFRMGRRSNDGIAEDIARAVLAAGYVHRSEIARELDRIAQANKDAADSHGTYPLEAAARKTFALELRTRAEVIRNG